MQERIFLEADVHERGFEAVFEVAHLALENAADEAFLGGAFDVEFLQPAVFEHGDARFERLGVDDDFLVDFLLRPDEPLDLLHEGGRGEFDGVQNALGLFRHGHRLEGFSSSTRAGVSIFGSRNSFLSAPESGVWFSGAPCGGRPAAMFSARSISLRVPFFEHVLGAALFGHHVGAGLDGFAVGFLLGSGRSRLWGGNAFRGGAAKNCYCS